MTVVETKEDGGLPYILASLPFRSLILVQSTLKFYVVKVWLVEAELPCVGMAC